MAYSAKEMEDGIIVVIVVRASRKSRQGLPYERWRVTLAPDVLKAETSQRLSLRPKDPFPVMNVSSLSIQMFVRSALLMPTGSQYWMTGKERIPDEESKLLLMKSQAQEIAVWRDLRSNLMGQ